MLKAIKNLLTKGKTRKIFAKFFSIGISVSMVLAMLMAIVLAMLPNNGAFAGGDKPDKFMTSAKANHWGRSDLRAYMNGVEKNANTLPLDTTNHYRQQSGYYESQFSEAEYKLVQPFTYSTNVLDRSANATSVYETTDRFWLPSVNGRGEKILSWGKEDISADEQRDRSKTSDNGRLIPISYWGYVTPVYSWLRSPYYNYDNTAQLANRVTVTGLDVDRNFGLAAAFKIDLTSVIFASAASAASFPATGGAKKFVIAGSDKFGQKTDDLLPNYGMYLRTKADDGVEFTPDKLTFDGANLTVNYSGGEADHYVVVHAFTEDSLSDGHTSYVAAQKLVESGTSATINVSAWGLSSLKDYTIKVWMEDGSSGSSLAAATTPATFYGTSSGISNTGTEIKNARVFAMKEDLQCSWGDLSELSEDDFKKVIAGKNADATGGVMGTNPTNQKLYLGTANGEPIEFWIAGREDKADDGIIKSDGDIMTLYQATSVENTQFNAYTSNYDFPEKPAVTLQLADEQSVEYTGSAVNYPAGKITFKQDTKDLGENTLKWQHREPGTTTWETGMPTKIGSYEIRCYAEGTDNYEQTSSAVVNFTITKASPTAKNFTFTVPHNLTYDGSEKKATVTTDKAGMGSITAKYFTDEGCTEEAPNVINAGTYYVAITVGEGENYASKENLTDSTWKYEIEKATPAGVDSSSLYTTDTTYGYTLGQVLDADKLQKLIKLPQFNGDYIKGTWSWVDRDDTSVGDVGEHTFKAKFTPDESIKDNFDWSKTNGWNASLGALVTDVRIKVTPLGLSEDSITINLGEEHFTYDGTEKKPTVTVTYGSKTLTENTDYTITWPSDCVNAGDDKKLTVKFKGNYTGAIDKTYKIQQKLIRPQITVSGKPYDGTTDATVSVRFDGLVDGETLENEVDYKIDSATFDDANAGEGKTVNATITLIDFGKAKNYKLSSDTATGKANITKADPTYTQNPIKITAKYGQTLTDAGWNSTLVAPKDVNGEELSGEWGLKDNKNNTVELSTQLNSTGTFNYKAIFILNGSNPNYNTVQIDCTVVVEANTENWGNVEQLPNGKIQYVDNDGTTGIEVSSSNLDENGILWLKEDSDGSSAWYGLKIGDAFDLDKGYRFSVRWLSPKDADYDTYYSQLDDATRAEVDSNRGWTFLVEVKDQSGELIQPQLNKTVNLYVQIGDDWDKEDLQAYYITQGKDESVQVQYGTATYPEGTDEFGVMTLQHFSPYFIYDKLTDEEKAQLDATAEELATQQGRTTEVNEISNNESTKTGDEITYFTIYGLGFIMTLAFGLMTISKINRKKFNK